MRRDDDSPAPWTDEGKKRIRKLGLTMIMGSAHEEIKQQHTQADDEAPSTSDAKKGKKRRSQLEHVPTKVRYNSSLSIHGTILLSFRW